MEKKKKQLIMIAVLVPIMGFVVYTNLLAPKKKQPPPPSAGTPLPSEPAAVAKPAVAGAKTTGGELPPLDAKLADMQARVADETWGRDAFNPAPTPPEQPGEASDWKNFRVSGLIPGPAGGVAIINGQEIAEGESYRTYRLLEIDFENYAITLEKDGQKCRLEMPQE